MDWRSAIIGFQAYLKLEKGLSDNSIEAYSLDIDKLQHLAYIQTLIGYKVKPDMPGLKGPEVKQLYVRGAEWLGGGAL